MMLNSILGFANKEHKGTEWSVECIIDDIVDKVYFGENKELFKVLLQLNCLLKDEEVE